MGAGVISTGEVMNTSNIFSFPFPDTTFTSVQGTWVYSLSISYWGAGFIVNTSNTQNDEFTFPISLTKGVYTIIQVALKNNSQGIATISVDGSVAGTLDWYKVSDTANSVQTITNVTISTSGIHTISVKMATKNPASSGYYNYCNYIRFLKTS